MNKNTGKPEDFLNNHSTASTRRKVLLTMAGSAATLSGMSIQGAKAAGLSAARIQNFFIAVGGFNNMANFPNQADNPMNSVLADTVAVFKISDDGPWRAPLPKAQIIAQFYGLYNLYGTYQWPSFDPFFNGAIPNFSHSDRVTGNGNNAAWWIDTDGSRPDRINYTFKFDDADDLISVLHAR
jgi:hypothetical protein